MPEASYPSISRALVHRIEEPEVGFGRKVGSRASVGRSGRLALENFAHLTGRSPELSRAAELMNAG
jgi:hypothetical protein